MSETVLKRKYFSPKKNFHIKVCRIQKTHMTTYIAPAAGYFVYTKSNCDKCVTLKNILKDATFINCDEYLEDVDEFLDWLWSLTGDKYPRTFPMVFKDGEFLGGFKEFTEQFETNVSF